jgi:N utilization substance protein A
MENLNLVETFSEFKEFRNIDRPTMMKILEEVFLHLLTKKHGSADNFDVIVNIDKGALEIWRYRKIVNDDEITDSNTEISYSDAIKIEPDFEIGEEVYEPVKLSEFQRREILTIRQHLNSKLLELEKDNVYKKYKNKIGEIISGEVYQVWRKEILVLDEEGIELVLPRNEQISSDFYKKGDTLRAVVHTVEMKNASPIIYISRTSEVFLERLLEQEVPEIFDGLITIKKIVRIPGERAKVAVESYDERIDPVGACVGMKGSRIHGIVKELRFENIDVINFTTNIQLYISRSLSPAMISSIKIIEETKQAEVFLKSDQVSLAIGKGGHNIKLAAKLTGYEIDVFRDSTSDTEDVALQEFSDEIEEWIIEEFRKVGFDTAKSVLETSLEELVKRIDLEEETILEVLKILKSEFE